MVYSFYSFDGTTMPGAESVDISPGPSETAYVRLAGGLEWDAWKSERAPVRHVTYDTTVIATGASSTGLRSKVDTWLAKRGVRGTLIRVDDASSQHSLTARLSEVEVTRGPGLATWTPIQMTFESAEYPWRGTAITTGISITSSGGNTTSMANSGDYPTNNVTITIATATGAGHGLSAITFLMGPDSESRTWSWSWTGTVATSTGSLVIDCAAKTITNDGAAASSGFARAAAHNQNDWVLLSTGTNTYAITLTGTSSDHPATVSITYNDGWA